MRRQCWRGRRAAYAGEPSRPKWTLLSFCSAPRCFSWTTPGGFLLGPLWTSRQKHAPFCHTPRRLSERATTRGYDSPQPGRFCSSWARERTFL